MDRWRPFTCADCGGAKSRRLPDSAPTPDHCEECGPACAALPFDPHLNMWRQDVRTPDRAHLRFERWLVEHGRIGDRGTYGPPCGEFAPGAA